MLSLWELGALGFAAARVTQLVVHDSIGDPLRARFEMFHARKFDSKIRTFFRDMLSCIYCVSFHAAWMTVLVYSVATDRSHTGFSGFILFGIESFAVAGIASLLVRIDDTLPVRG